MSMIRLFSFCWFLQVTNMPHGPMFFFLPLGHSCIKTAMESGGHSARLALRRNWQRAILVGLDRQHWEPWFYFGVHRWLGGPWCTTN